MASQCHLGQTLAPLGMTYATCFPCSFVNNPCNSAANDTELSLTKCPTGRTPNQNPPPVAIRICESRSGVPVNNPSGYFRYCNI